MKNTLLLLLSIFVGSAAMAQVTIPHFYDFETTPAVPAGWATNTTSFYSSGVSGISGKLNQQSQYFSFSFLDDPGELTYHLKGWVGGGAQSWDGTFTVEESTDGVSWTTLEQYVDNLSTTTYTQYTTTPAAATRYIRFYFTNKISGANVGIDDVNLIQPVAGPPQEINVVYGGNNVPSTTQVSFSSPVGVLSPETFTVENLGTVNDLNISGTSVTGANSADFVVSSAPTLLGAGTNAPLVIDFTPSVAGTRTATLSIANDDSNENPYIIELYGVGGSLVTEPAAPATNLNFTDVKSYRMTVNYTASASADGYLIIRGVGAAPTGQPVDGTVYTRGDAVGGDKIAYIGASTSFIPNYFHAGTDYHYAVYAYNGFGAFINYLESTPLVGMQTTSADMIGSYYNGIDPLQNSFVSDLTALINPHSFTWYSEYDETMMKKFVQRDTANGQKVVTCVYSNELYVYSEPFTWSDYSREHTFCHSWMPTEPADNPEQPEYNDQHHLFPARFDDVNALRSNYPLGEVVNVSQSYMEGLFGTNAAGVEVYEPKDGHKGDAARAIFYMCAAYNDIDGNGWQLPSNIGIFVPYGQDQDILRQWHHDDAPDNWEMARNDFLDSLQGNRNPFVDHPDWICYIDFYNMNYIANPGMPCETTPDAIDEIANLSNLEVFPIPSNGTLNVAYNLVDADNVTLRLLDMSGKVIREEKVSGTPGEHKMTLKTSLAAGLYQLELSGAEFSVTHKVVITK
jgi:endonuclease I